MVRCFMARRQRSNSPTSRNPPSSPSSQRTEQGQTAETSIVGREGMIGSSAIHGIMTSFAECVVQVRGEIVRVPASELHRVGKASESFRKVIALFDLSLLAQAQQSTACQALHQVESAQQGGFSSAVNGWERMTSN